MPSCANGEKGRRSRRQTKTPTSPLSARGWALAHGASGSAKSNRRDLGQDPQRRLLRPAAAEVEANRAMHPSELLLGETFGAQRVEAIPVRLAAADRPDVAGIFRQHRTQRGQV